MNRAADMTRRITVALALAVLVAATSVTAVSPAAAAGTPSASVESVVVTRGNVAEISVSHSAPANLTIGSQEVGFEVVVPLGGAGTDTVKLDTYNTTGPASSFVSVEGATLRTPQLSKSLAPGEYTLSVTIDGTRYAVGTLTVTPRKNTTATTGVAPADLNASTASPGKVAAATTTRRTVAHGDYAVFVVNTSGLSRAFNPSDLTGGAAANGIDARIVELDPPPNTVADTYQVTSSGDFAVVSQMETQDRFFVLWDTDSVPLDAMSNHTYEFRVTLRGKHNALVTEDKRIVTERVTLVKPRVSISARPGFTLAPWDNGKMRVTGTTNLAPGTHVDVRALKGKPNPRLWNHIVAVSKNGTFSASFDFSAANAPAAFPLWVREYRDETQHTVRLTAANASVTFRSQEVRDGAVRVASVSLTHAGFVRVGTNNTTYGSVYVPPGSHEDVRVPLTESVSNATTLTATVLADANRNATLNPGDVPYTRSGTPVNDTATVIPAAGQTPGNNTTTSTSAANTTTATTSTTLHVEDGSALTPADAKQRGGGSSGGFVPLSPLAAVVAFAAAASLAGKR